jgi:hypothetical protein
LIGDTIVSDNAQNGININPTGTNAGATLSRITANNNSIGVATNNTNTTIANSVMSNNSNSGLQSTGGVTVLAKNVISGNANAILVGATVYSYGDNYIVTFQKQAALTPISPL